jgi:hypothetical protein
VLVPINIGADLAALPASDTAVTAIVVVRPGTTGFLVAAQLQTTGTYTVTTVQAPDPSRLCVPTYATLGVVFNTALTPTCVSRDIRIVPSLRPAQQLRASVTSATRAITLELRSAGTGALLQSVSTSGQRPLATLSYTNGAQSQAVFLRVIGSRNVNDLVPVTISP